MNNVELTAHIKRISEEKFQKSFDHEARWNSRLQSTGGRFFPKDLHLDFNPKMAGLPDFDKIILHELVHYHLYRAHRGYKHGDSDFKQLLAKVGGSRFAPVITPPKFIYICRNCGTLYSRQRQLDIQKYRCGKCRGKLKLKNA